MAYDQNVSSRGMLWHCEFLHHLPMWNAGVDEGFADYVEAGPFIKSKRMDLCG